MPAKPPWDQLAAHYHRYREFLTQQLASNFEWREGEEERGRVFKDLVKLHLCLEQALREALACRSGHKNNMKTSLSAALFSLPETTNSGAKKGDEEGKSECSPGAPFTSCADEKIGEKGLLGS